MLEYVDFSLFLLISIYSNSIFGSNSKQTKKTWKRYIHSSSIVADVYLYVCMFFGLYMQIAEHRLRLESRDHTARKTRPLMIFQFAIFTLNEQKCGGYSYRSLECEWSNKIGQSTKICNAYTKVPHIATFLGFLHTRTHRKIHQIFATIQFAVQLYTHFFHSLALHNIPSLSRTVKLPFSAFRMIEMWNTFAIHYRRRQRNNARMVGFPFERHTTPGCAPYILLNEELHQLSTAATSKIEPKAMHIEWMKGSVWVFLCVHRIVTVRIIA